MEGKENWRFKGNNYTYENGLDTADMETFKKDPIASLARESCQNSIDAKKDGEKKVVIEFKTFEINNEDIPGYDRLRAEIENCKEYKKVQNNRKDYEQLSDMSKAIEKESITCLRISDFNTTGLYGEKFYLLTKGSGITDKTGITGGSKGIGKYASFVASRFNTVFYSTYTVDGECKCLGISKLCSAPMDGTDEKTMGTGYYGFDSKNTPMDKQLELDNKYKRTSSGTDLYILGFKKEDSWKQQILSMLLDSFLVAVYKDELEIKVDDISVNKDNLKEIVENDNLITKNLRKSIISQYLLVSEGEGVFIKETDILGYGNVKIFVKSFSRDDSDMATNNCVMIRYPYMKIKSFPGISTMPCSAMCIIENNKLNEQLKDIENPQHTDWEPKRKNDESLRSEIKNIIQQMRNTIIDFVVEVLSTSETEKLDIEGAGDYLPESNDEQSELIGGEQESSIVKDTPVIIKRVDNKKYSKNPIIETNTLEGIAPDIGDHNDEGDDSPVPTGNNSGSQGEPHESEETQGSCDDGDKDILRHVPLTDIKKVFFVSNKENGEYISIIDSVYEEGDCELEVYYYDDAGNQYKANIVKCIVNDVESKIENGKAVRFKINLGKNKAVIYTDLRDYYRCEVKLYANR
ncbi:MAG: hypothetical protein IJ890_02575 [Clostridia bacterium]|nr:hypothetical protein [Clostridia bacterium]